MDFAVQILFVGRPLHVSQRQTCERYRHRQWDGVCRADFILSPARFKFLKSETCERDAGKWMDCI